jgi:gliding motility-associated-like protein
MAKKIRIWITFLFIPFLSFATHVVGGSLTYVYNGGSSYTITLKLYRDCGAGTAALPGSVTIQIVGNDGLPFTPSKNVTINLTSVTNIAASLNPCAIPPNPAPCVEEAIYTTTVNNLPPNPGGYHMYFQICCRNGSILNITNPGAAGESFYANIPGMSINSVWNEDFTLPNSTTVDNGATSWSIAPGIIAPSSVGVTGSIFQIAGANNASETWSSQVVSIASCGSASLSVDLAENGTLEPNDSIIVYYRLNGGPLIPFPVNGIKADDFTSATASASGLIGTTIQIVIRVHFDGASPNSEIYSFDNVNISCIGNNFIPNSNPVFNLFPPLFICVNQPFTFDHSAMDANGDSLVYSLYQPYNNTAPMFTNNTASFTPITYVGGYNSTNPLGAGPFSINPSTGLLSGTPGTQGQFVVGVMVKEYRNGVYIGQTLRDFQFNVVNCPQPPPTLAVPNATINNGCSAKLTATGISSTSSTWTSISPGIQGAYNNYLACTSGCLNNTVTPVGAPPAFVDFLVCGISTSCAGTFICDTFRVTFNPTLGVTIIPLNPTLCFGQTSTTITANGSGGTPPYSYLWNNINPSQTISVGVGTYNVKLTDASGCPPVFNTVSVTAFSVAISANAGPNQTKCIQSPLATLNGTVTGASGGIWSGGTGTFIPNNTTLSNVTYSPTSAEIASGSVNLYLTTTGNGSCPSKQDTIKINYSGFTGIATPTIVNISCYGGGNGSAAFGMSSGFTPYTYLWNTAPTQTTSIVNNLTIGTYSVTIKDGIGCTYQTSVTIIQPTPLAVSGTTTNVSCNGGSNGSITSAASGGTTPYAYLWSVGGQTTSAVSGLPAGTYSLTVTDAKGCQKTSTYTITQPLPIAITFTSTQVSCFNGSDGTVNSTVTGGTLPYTYSWSPNGASAPSVSGLSSGTYTLLVTDNFSCTASNSITITQPTALTVTTSAVNETCDYLNNGSASVTPTGGTTPYSYTWSPGGQTTAGISSLASGTYSVIVNDSKGCSVLALVTVTQPPTLTVGIVNQINVSCFGGIDGSVGATPAGGTPNYTYSWTPNNSSSASVNNLTIGTYTIKITDSKACIATNTVTIIQPTPLAVSGTTTNVSCNGGSNGSITSAASGGTTPYAYLWSVGGQTTSAVSGLPAGTYSLTVTDAKGCQKTSTYTITQPLPIAITFTSTQVSCFNGSDGTVNSTVTGGTLPYTYSWSPNGASAPSVSGLSSGTYTLLVTDNFSCTASNSITITQPTALTVTTSAVNETCDYLNNGSASVTPTGGTTPYSYTWSPGGQTTAGISSLASGTYSVIVNDSKGCSVLALVTVTQPPTLTVGIVNQINVSCFGGIDGSVGATPAGGTPNYTYSWTPNNSSSASVNNLTIGTYTIKITDSKACIATNTVTIIQPTVLVPSVSSVSTTCYGGSNGSLSSVASGGTASYTYTWMPGNITTPTVSNLTAGTYTVNVTDSKGCLASNSVTITQPTPILPVTSSTNSTCGFANGIAGVSVSGGFGPYTYSWSPSGGTGSTASGLLSAAYDVYVTDTHGCVASQYVNINDSGGPIILISSTTNVNCNGGSDGSATAGVNGGQAPFSYTWTPSGGNGTIAANGPITATGLSAGLYYITVSDINGCQSLATTNPNISEPPPIIVNITTSNVSCFAGANGSATVTAGGGTPGYTYTWLPSASTGSTIAGLSANVYSVQVKDSHNCIQNATYTITQPTAAVSVAVSSTSVSCFGGSNGSTSAIAAGGTAPYNYNWTAGNFSSPSISNLTMGTYTVTVTDNKNCVAINTINVIQPTPIVLTTGSSNSNCSLANGQASVNASGGMGGYTYSWSPTGGTNATATGLLAGSYTISVSDGNSCPKTATQTVLDNPTPTITIASTTSISCNGGADGTATASVTGGIAPYTYTWSPSGGNGITGVGLTTGIYTVTTTASNGCQAIAITSLIPQPSLIYIITTPSNVSCFAGANGSATVTAGGGTPGYTYTWLPSASTGSTIAGLSANVYSVQVKDSHNCLQNATYTISQPTAAVSVAVSSTSVSCFGGSNGSTSAIAAGGTAPYSYTWSPVTSYSSSVSGLPIGTYTVSVKDSKGCISSASINVTQPTQSLSATGNGVPTSCSGGSNGTASVSPIGGMPGYTYSWTPTGGIGQSASGLSPGNYVVVVSDINNCQTNVPIIVGQPSAVSGTLIPINAACNNANGSISSQITGGTGPYSYLWSSGSITTPIITGLLPGTYSLQVTDAANCLSNYTTSLINVPGPSIVLSSTVNDSCFGGNNGKATVALSQGTAPLNINWLPYGGNSVTASLLVAGIYTANVTDARGCQNSITATITEPSPLSISINTITNVSCFNGNNGSITVAASGGTPSYSYSWSPSGVGPTINNLTAGSYTVSVKDSHLCLSSISMGVSQPTSPLTSTISGVNLLCFNSTGSASSSASGGTSPYTYTWTTTPIQNGSTALNIGSGTYTVTIYDANGCSASNSITITRPTSIISNTGVNDTICLGQSGILTASATGGAGNYYYVWQPFGITNSGTLTVSPTTTSNYTVVAFDQNGCAGSSDTVKAIVFSLTSANIQTFGLSPICPGQSSVISALVSGNTGPVSYSWNHGLGNGPGPYIVIPSQPTNYVVTVSNSCGISVLDSVIIAFNPPPTIFTSISGTLNCIPNPLSFFDNSITGNSNDPISNWLWDFGDGTTSNSQNPNHVYTTAGTYSVNLTVTTDAGCTNNNGASPIIVNAYPNPVASFTVNSTLLNLPYDVLVCTNQSSGATTYNWNFGDGNTSTAVNPSYLYTSVGEYLIQLIATSNFGCTDTAYAHVITDADIVFPNAFTPNTAGSSGGYYDPKSIDNDIFFPYSSGVIDFKFQIFDRWGELIFETDNIKQGWDGYYRDKPCQVGVYVWKAYAKLNNGKIFNKTGDVTLLK